MTSFRPKSCIVSIFVPCTRLLLSRRCAAANVAAGFFVASVVLRRLVFGGGGLLAAADGKVLNCSPRKPCRGGVTIQRVVVAVVALS